MYASRNGQVFGLGHASRGVTAPAVTWFLAEGATGPFFDTYVLIANPFETAATIDARFDTADGASISPNTRWPNSRFSIYLDSIPGLEFTSVATTITSTNAAPVVVERAMYWPNGFFDYYEGHSSPGTTRTGLKWVLAEGENGPGQTFVSIANTAATAGRARLTVMPESSDAPHVFELPLAPNSRVTVPIDASRNASGRFGVLVDSMARRPYRSSSRARSTGRSTASRGQPARTSSRHPCPDGIGLSLKPPRRGQGPEECGNAGQPPAESHRWDAGLASQPIAKIAGCAVRASTPTARRVARAQGLQA